MPDPTPLIQIEKPELGRASDSRVTQEYIDARPELGGVPPFVPGVDVDLVDEINQKMASLHAQVRYASPELAAGLIGVLDDLGTLVPQIEQLKTDTEQSAAYANGLSGVAPQDIYTENETPAVRPDGTQGIQYTLSGVWKRIKRTAGAWVEFGSPMLSLLGLRLRLGINVLDYGAVGDGVTDDWPAINAAAMDAAAAAAAGKKVRLLFPNAVGYASSQTVNVVRGIDPWMDAPLISLSPADVPMELLKIGMTSAEADASGTTYANSANDKRGMKLWVQRKNQGDWASEADVGIHLYNMIRSRVEIVETSGFTVGAMLHGQRWGFAYNQIHAGVIGQNKVGLDFVSEGTAVLQGYANENTVYGGHYTNNSALGNRSRIGVRQRWIGTLYQTNNNRFYSPCFEIKENSLTGNATAACFENIDAINTRVYAARHETALPDVNARPVFAREIGRAGGSVYDIMYGDRGSVIDDSAALYKTSRIEQTGTFSFLNVEKPQVVWTSGRLRDLAVVNGGLTTFGDRLFLVTSGGVKSNNAANYTIGADHITSSFYVGVGVSVDTTRTRRFMVRRNVTADSAYGRVYIKPYDANGNPLIGGGAITYVAGDSLGAITWGTSWGGAYLQQSDGYAPQTFFSTHPDVASVDIMLGLFETKLKSFQILTAENAATTFWSGVTAPVVAVAAAPTLQRAFDSGYLPGITAAYDATKVTIQRQSNLTYASGSLNLTGTGISINPDHIAIDNGGGSYWGTLLDTTQTRKLVVTRNVLNARGGRLRIAAWDAAGVRLTGAGDVTGAGITLAGTTNMYQEGVDTVAAKEVSLSAAVARVHISIGGGTNPVQLVSWTVDSYGPSRASSGVENVTPEPGANYATQAPAFGAYVAGKRVLSLAPAPGGKAGWICTASGTPGTWKPFGAIDA